MELTASHLTASNLAASNLAPMNLAALETFVTILDEGNLARAAQRLHVTQSTVTARLQSLEREIGQRLVDRPKSGATPTAAGQRVRRNAETMLDLWDQARRDAALPGAVTSVCTIGCDVDLWTRWCEGLVQAGRSADPSLAVSVRQGSSSELTDWHQRGLTDISLSYAVSMAVGQRVEVLGEDVLVLVSTDASAPIEFDPGYVFVEAGERFAHDHSAAYATANLARLSFSSATLGLAHLVTHGGSAYLPLRMVEDHLASGELHRLDAPEFTRDIHLVTPTDAADRWPWLKLD